MTTFESVLLMLLVADALALVVLVMLQQGKGADVGAAFGSGSSNTVFGSAGGASFLTRLTVWLAIGFFAISFGLAYFAQQRAETLQDLGIPDIPLAEQLDAAADGVAEADAGLPSLESELTPDAQSVDSDIPEI
ncbi:MAG: preprotein translocase subunit SecG [Pseudomonadales bacterium]